jgi:uncharacterized membrane protein YqgA involved in biofilm formation
VTGTIINVIAIIVGSLLALRRRPLFSVAAQQTLRLVFGIGCMFAGIHLVWLGIGGPFFKCLKQLFIVMLALILGRLVGRLLRLQKLSNRVGRFARTQLESPPTSQSKWSDGFNVCAGLFCVAPLSWLGSVAGGLAGVGWPLLIKAGMDCLAAVSFAERFGQSVMMSALPVLAFQGTITLLMQVAAPALSRQLLTGCVLATTGMLVMFVSLLIMEVRKIEMADYLPSLALAPLLTWLWR